jgi:hypothetical protein
MLKQFNQSLLKALKANGRLARGGADAVLWFSADGSANSACAVEDGPPHLTRITWNRLDAYFGFWQEHHVYCLTAEIGEVAKWLAGTPDLCKLPTNMCRWWQTMREHKTTFVLRTAEYQKAIETGKQAARSGDIASMHRWLVAYGVTAA